VAPENATAELRAQLLPALPIEARALEAWVVVQWIRHLRLPFGGTV
jgi:hypothetical protein